MGWIFTLITAISILSAAILGNGQALSAAIPAGAQKGLTTAICLGGAICLWTGVGRLMEAIGTTQRLSKFLRPLLSWLFPTTKTDPQLAGSISSNICANVLGLGNAATPMGIQAVKQLAKHTSGDSASAEMCRLVVLNTASIQLIPATVAAVRSALGSASPYDILPAVWITSICAAGCGLLAAFVLEKVWRNA